MSLDISSIVRVNASIRPRGVLRKELGRTLFVTTDAVQSASGGDKVAVYARFEDVVARYNATHETYKAAQIYFAQSPYPRPLLVGRWAKDKQDTVINGGAPESLDDLKAVAAGSFRINGNDVEGVSLTAAISLAGVADSIQAALGNVADDDVSNQVSVEYDAANSRFVVKFGSGADVGLFEPHSAGTGTDISSLLGLDAASGATQLLGSAAEAIADCMDAIVDQDDSFYFVTIQKTEIDTDTIIELSAWAGARSVQFSFDTNDQSALTSNEEVSVLARISALGSPRSFATWSATADYKSLSIAARFSSVDFATPASLITGKFKTLVNCAADVLSPTQKAELDRKNANHYSPYGNDNIYADGTTLQSGTWIDARYWLDWFVNAVQTDVYNLLRSTPKVPQTTPGVAAIIDTIENVCRQGVRNGGIASGDVTAGMRAEIAHAVGQPDFDGRLSNGYIVVAGSLTDQSQADREARKSPPISVYLKGAGAIHSIEVSLIFEN